MSTQTRPVGIVHFRPGALIRFSFECFDGKASAFDGTIEGLVQNGTNSYVAKLSSWSPADSSEVFYTDDLSSKDKKTINIDWATQLIIPAKSDLPLQVTKLYERTRKELSEYLSDHVKKGWVQPSKGKVRFNLNIGLREYLHVALIKYDSNIGPLESIDIDRLIVALYDAGILSRYKAAVEPRYSVLSKKRFSKFLKSQLNKFKVNRRKKDRDECDELDESSWN